MRVFWATALLLAACADDNRSLLPLLNRCTPVTDCGRGSSCDPELGICTLNNIGTPYDFRLRITPPQPNDAGLFAISTTDRITLDGAVKLPALQLAKAVFVSGRVLASDGATTLEAELVFTPHDENALGGELSVLTGPKAGFSAQLVPNRSYDVMVYPRGPDSESFPPYSFQLATSANDDSHDFTYPALVALTGQVLQENDAGAPKGARIRTRWRDSFVASSSIGQIADQGKFSVLAAETVLSSPDDHELVLDLSELRFNGAVLPQNVQIAFDLSKRNASGRWTMPTLPPPVLFSGSVEISRLSDQPATSANVNAQLTWISDFTPPSGSDDKRQTDWCMLKQPGAPKDAFRCSAYVTSYVNEQQMANVFLLPGVYDVVVAPLGSVAQLLTPHRETYTIQSQPINGVQEGYTFQLDTLTLFAGKVQSPARQPMPSVSVSATALRVRDGLPEIALYNRSSSQLSDADGDFQLGVDVGVYDFIAAPPQGSGYAWVLRMNRRLAGDKISLQGMKPQFPILAQGRVISPTDAAVPMATVDAYAMVPNLAGGADRAVLIARTTTNTSGEYALQMPPYLGSPDDVDDSDAGVGEEVPLDAGMDAQR
jgi:hypothetical protein